MDGVRLQSGTFNFPDVQRLNESLDPTISLLSSLQHKAACQLIGYRLCPTVGRGVGSCQIELDMTYRWQWLLFNPMAHIYNESHHTVYVYSGSLSILSDSIPVTSRNAISKPTHLTISDQR